MLLKITVVAGDGIGPEVTDEAVRVLESVAHVFGHQLVDYQKRYWRGRVAFERRSIAE